MVGKDTRPQRRIAYYIDMMDRRADWKLRDQPMVYNAHPFADSRMEIDVYLPLSKVGIEYDGGRFHGGDPENELRKYQSCREQGITLYRVTDMDLGEDNPYTGTADLLVHVDDPSDITYEIGPMMSEIAELTGMGRYQDWKQSHQGMGSEDRFGTEPVRWTVSDIEGLSDSWDSDRNGYLYGKGPSEVGIDDPTRFAWRCPQCHEQYVATVSERMNGRSCAIAESGGRHKRKAAEEPRRKRLSLRRGSRRGPSNAATRRRPSACPSNPTAASWWTSASSVPIQATVRSAVSSCTVSRTT